MISRFIGVFAAIVTAYALAVLLGPHLPAIKIKTEASRPLSLPEILSKYLVHAPDERLHLLTTPRLAEWEGSGGEYVLYDLANAVPTADETYAPTGGNIESLYETLLLSLKAGDDVALEKLQRQYLAARNKALSYTFSQKKKNERRAAQQKALESLIRYVDNIESGPAPRALGKALRDYYGSTTPKIKIPGGEERNFRVVTASPPLSTLTIGSELIPVIDILVPPSQSVTATTNNLAVRAQQLRIAELTLGRPWLDLTILARTNGPWLTTDPGLFGPKGALARIPIRLALIERPIIDTSAAAAVPTGTGAVAAAVGPFIYAPHEVTATGNMLSLRPTTSQWVIVAVISREL